MWIHWIGSSIFDFSGLQLPSAVVLSAVSSCKLATSQMRILVKTRFPRVHGKSSMPLCMFYDLTFSLFECLFVYCKNTGYKWHLVLLYHVLCLVLFQLAVKVLYSLSLSLSLFLSLSLSVEIDMRKLPQLKFKFNKFNYLSWPSSTL